MIYLKLKEMNYQTHTQTLGMGLVFGFLGFGVKRLVLIKNEIIYLMQMPNEIVQVITHHPSFIRRRE